MRVWDLDPKYLCDRHLLGEHNEIHAIWSIIIGGLEGFSRHPETRRWHGKLKALYLRHEKTAGEMERRGFKHKSALGERLATGKAVQDELLAPVEVQERLLSEKDADCAERIRRKKASSPG